jgi:hypothetical protein
MASSQSRMFVNLWPVRMASGWQPAPVLSTTNSNPFRSARVMVTVAL